MNEINLTLNETSEELGQWISEEVNEMVFIAEMIGQFEHRLEKEGLKIRKTFHPKHDYRDKPFYVIDLGWFSVVFYRKDELEKYVISINIEIKNNTSHNPNAIGDPFICLKVDMLVKLGKKIHIVDFKVLRREDDIRYPLIDYEIEEINKVINVINDMNKAIPDF